MLQFANTKRLKKKEKMIISSYMLHTELHIKEGRKLGRIKTQVNFEVAFRIQFLEFSLFQSQQHSNTQVNKPHRSVAFNQKASLKIHFTGLPSSIKMQQLIHDSTSTLQNAIISNKNERQGPILPRLKKWINELWRPVQQENDIIRRQKMQMQREYIVIIFKQDSIANSMNAV